MEGSSGIPSAMVFSRKIKTTVTVAVPDIEASSSQNQDVGERNPPDADAGGAQACLVA